MLPIHRPSADALHPAEPDAAAPGWAGWHASSNELHAGLQVAEVAWRDDLSPLFPGLPALTQPCWQRAA